MNLHALAGPAVGTVNPNKVAELFISTGYAKDATHKQVPTYSTVIMVTAQVQALTQDDLRQLQNIDQQGVSHTAYLYGEVDGVVREDNRGGDVLVFDGWEHLVVSVLEAWPGWCKVALARQGRRTA